MLKVFPFFPITQVFPSARFAGFCHLYFRIATAVEAFQEMGRIYFNIMRDSMFEDPNKRMDRFDSDVDEPDPDPIYRLINHPLPDLKTVSKKTWVKIGVVSTALLATGVGIMVGSTMATGK